MTNQEGKVFTCSIDIVSKVITTLIITFTVTLLIIPWVKFEENTAGAALTCSITGVALVMLMVITYGYSPRKYVIDGKNIKIKRIFGDKLIPASEIKLVRLPVNNEINWPIRTFGNGGLFGYTGRYYTGKIGNMQWYCSRRSNYVIILREGRPPVIISPDLPNEFIAEYYA